MDESSVIPLPSTADSDTLVLPKARPLSVVSHGLTDPGRVRRNNEDQFLIAVLQKTLQIQQSSLRQAPVQQSPDRSYVFVVADGMGGRAGGEEASALAIGTVEAFILRTFKWFAQFKGSDHAQVLDDFQKALRQAHARVLAEGSEHAELRGMGTTLTLAYSLNDVLFVAHVGDCRCYLRRGGKLFRLTRDHTLVDEMVRRGELTAEEAARHRLRHIITNTVGSDPKDVKVELHKLSLEDGDRLLLCSDGLTEMLVDQAINEALAAETDPKPAGERLVDAANAAGGRDNVTVIVADYRRAPTEDCA